MIRRKKYEYHPIPKLWLWLSKTRLNLWDQPHSVRPASFFEAGFFLWGRLLFVRPASFWEAGFFLWGWLLSVSPTSFCDAASFCEAMPHYVRPKSICEYGLIPIPFQSASLFKQIFILFFLNVSLANQALPQSTACVLARLISAWHLSFEGWFLIPFWYNAFLAYWIRASSWNNCWSCCFSVTSQ